MVQFIGVVKSCCRTGAVPYKATAACQECILERWLTFGCMYGRLLLVLGDMGALHRANFTNQYSVVVVGYYLYLTYIGSLWLRLSRRVDYSDSATAWQLILQTKNLQFSCHDLRFSFYAENVIPYNVTAK